MLRIGVPVAVSLALLASIVIYVGSTGERSHATGEDTWSPAAPMPTVRAYHHAVALTDGRVMMFHGLDGTGSPPAPTIYDPTLDSWSSASVGWGTAYAETGTLLGDGTVLVTTLTPGDAVTKARRFDPATNAWNDAGSLAALLTQYTATLRPDGTVVVIGGWDSGAQAPNLAIELYSPATNSWSIESTSGRAHVAHTATMLPNGSILIAGGYDGYAGRPLPELYTAGIWAPAGTAAGRLGHTATLMSDGKVLVVGGQVRLPQGGTALIDPEVYDPASNTWSPAGNLLVQLHTATLLSNGLVLVTGGSDTSIRASARVYIPSANDWAFVSPMSVPRRAHVAGLLADGRVLVAGGESPGAIVALASAEIYTPPSVIPPPNTATPTATPTNTATPTPTNTPDGSPPTFTFSPTGTPTSTPTSTLDSDGDGCFDWKEEASNPQHGGLRDPQNPWDFFDVNGSRKIDAVDIALVRARFNPSEPVQPEDEIYDRSPGLWSWAPGPPNGVINAVDIALVRASFNHSCQ